jgi:hypothetical protein
LFNPAAPKLTIKQAHAAPRGKKADSPFLLGCLALVFFDLRRLKRLQTAPSKS